MDIFDHDINKRWYVLDENKQLVKVDGLEDWVIWRCSNSVHVAYNRIGDSIVSTVFLGLDHNWLGGKPSVFETLVLSGTFSDGARYSTYEEAKCGHEAWLIKIRERERSS